MMDSRQWLCRCLPYYAFSLSVYLKSFHTKTLGMGKQAWYFVILALWRLRQEDYKSKASLASIMGPLFQKQKLWGQSKFFFFGNRI
jgi:hypothetical protein